MAKKEIELKKQLEEKYGGLFYPLYQHIDEIDTISECVWVKEELQGFVGNLILKLAEGKMK